MRALCMLAIAAALGGCAAYADLDPNHTLTTRHTIPRPLSETVDNISQASRACFKGVRVDARITGPQADLNGLIGTGDTPFVFYRMRLLAQAPGTTLVELREREGLPPIAAVMHEWTAGDTTACPRRGGSPVQSAF